MKSRRPIFDGPSPLVVDDSAVVGAGLTSFDDHAADDVTGLLLAWGEGNR